MIVSVVGAAGGVGSSTLALLLSAAVRESGGEVALVEADRAGGVVGARFELGVNSGVGAWVAGLAADRSSPVSGFGRLVTEGFRVVPGPPGGVEAEKVLTAQTVELMASAMSTDAERWWTVDVGRCCSVVRPLAASASVAVVVSSGAAEEVAGLASLVESLRPARSVLVLGSRSAWPAAEVAKFCGAAAVVRSGVNRLDGVDAVALIEGNKRRRSSAWRAAVECRDKVIEVAGAPGSVVADRSVS